MFGLLYLTGNQQKPNGGPGGGEEGKRTAAFDSRFSSQSQTRNCCQNYLDFHCCKKTMTGLLGKSEQGGERGPGYMVIPTLRS
uniref:Uncharacterized protein n=1 Tax=Suricata suricatta TaxID=37032 RepID=A0A673TF61_SURSU